MTLEELINRPELPSIPEALLKLNDLVKRDRPLKEITKVIEHDPSITSRSLQLANSAWYMRPRKITTVKEAIATIGLDALHQLVFATSVIRTFQSIDENIVNMRLFWNQSIILACNAKAIREIIDASGAIQIFTTGIVTYIGKLLIYMDLPKESHKILQNCSRQPELQHVEEKKLLGFSHNEVAAALFNKWNIPESIYTPIQYYVNPLSAPEEYTSDAATLFLAHLMVYKDVKEFDFEGTNHLNEVLTRLTLTEQQLTDSQQRAVTQVSQASTIVGITNS